MMTTPDKALEAVFTFWQPRWDEFLSTHAIWLRARLREADEIFFVPTAQSTAYACAFALRPDEIAAEAAFLGVCRQFKIVGVRIIDAGEIQSSAQFIQFEGLEAPAGPSDASWLELGRGIGWDEKMIQNARIALRKADEMQLRMVGAAGRLICMPEFLAERDALRDRWTSLTAAQRPSLPLHPIVRANSQPERTKFRQLSEAATQFVESFEIFCQKWEVNGFETWNLPNLRGPHWPDFRSPPGRGSSKATMTLTTPWHFPALDSDGLGDMAMEQLRAERERHGIDDERAWRQYGQLFRLDVRERTLQARYADRPRPRDFVSQIERLLADILEVSLERVERLRKLHRALKAGRRRSLAGVR
jgi:hypothetical protein